MKITALNIDPAYELECMQPVLNGVNGDDGVYSAHETGRKKYELKNHLGNVHVLVSDKKVGQDTLPGPTTTDGIIDYYLANVVDVSDYYPFGWYIRDRKDPQNAVDEGGYRFGFGGKEKDDEIKGSGNSYDFGERIYDPKIGRWLSRDPFAEKYAEHSPYNFALNNPIYLVDPGGDTVTVHVTAVKVGTTKINLHSSIEVKDVKDKAGKVIKKGVKQKTKTVDVYRVDVTNESGSTATFYFTRKSYRGDKDNTSADPKDVTFDPSTDGELFLGKIGSRWNKTDNVLEITPTSGKRADGYDSYRGLADDRELVNRKYIQFHIKGASDGCLLCVGSGQFESTEEGVTIDKTNLSSNSGGTQTKFMSKIKALQKEDKDAGKSDVISVKVDQLKK